jgi:pilus assembly protein CpaF
VGSLSPSWAAVLRALVLRRAAFLVTGGTGAGKTTLLSALLGLVPGRERVVLVEDVGELRPVHPHVVRLEARHANVEGRGAVTLDDLVRQALRMRPDRIVVGECRGPEVRELLAALNTGHAGGCGTLHANAAAEVPARLEALGSLAGLDRAAVRSQAAAALDAVVHVERARSGRRVTEVAVVSGGSGGSGGSGLEVVPALVAGEARPGPGWPELARRLGLPVEPAP